MLLTTTQDIIDSFEFFDKRSDFVDYQQLMIPEGTKHTTVFTGDIPSVLTTDL